MSTFDVNDSIAAIASPPGSAVRGVIRLSGPQILVALQQCFASNVPLDEQTTAVVLPGSICIADPIGRVSGDLLYWPGTASYTRQRSAEFHCSGALPLLNEVMRTLGECGVRQAQPGEFTMRAFLAGRIDLTRAEAVLGVIDSQSQHEINVALRQLAGGLSGPITKLQDHLLEVVAHIEAGLDFVEDDIEFISRDAMQAAIDNAGRILQGILRQIDQRQLNQQVPRVVLVGRPNAGKSCLQNALAKNPTAIVSEVAGTTRDYLIANAVIDGLELQLIDTAGTMREAEFDVSSIQELAEVQTQEVAGLADLAILCVDGNTTPDSWEQSQIDGLANSKSPMLLVQTKSDLSAVWSHEAAIPVSTQTGAGLNLLCRAIVCHLKDSRSTSSGEMVGSTAHRCFESLQNAAEELAVASGYCQTGHGDEIIAAALRVVLDQLAVVTGRVFTDDILDRVFSRFCIGK